MIDNGYPGGILTGNKIKEEYDNKNIIIDPFDVSCLNPNSYNLHISNTLKVYDEEVLDPKKNNSTKTIIIPEDGFLLEPHKLYIGSTIERTFTDKYVPCIDGRSSYGRFGMFIHITAGFGDIGFNGTWTLEIMTSNKLIVYPNSEICQIYFMTPFGNCDIKYDGRYQNQIDPTPSRSYERKKVYLK